MSAPIGIPIALPPAVPERPGQTPAPEGAERKRLWLASLEEALRRDGERAGAERRSRRVVVPPGWPAVPISVQAQPAVAQAAPELVTAMDRESVVASAVHAVQGAEPREPLRWHAEWSGAGVRLWLGSDRQVDDAAIGAQVAAVIAELRRQLEVRGVRLLTVTCNGREVWSYPAAAESRTVSISQEEP